MPANAPDGSLLLYCLGVGPNVTGVTRPPELTASDWDVVLRQAAVNNVIPLLYHRLKTLPTAPPVPSIVLDQLRDVSFRSAANSLRVARELSEMLDAFRSHGVAFVVLKGAHLGQLVYGSSALRTMCDLDVLVRRGDLDRAAQVLTDLTYAPQYFGVEAVDYAHHHHLRPMAKSGGIRVELHWGIAPPFARFEIDIDGLWERARPAQIAGIEALTLSPEDLVLHLCLHASFSHKFRVGLRACWDILELIRHDRTTVDWEEVVRRARLWKIDRYVYLTLRLVREMLGAEIPLAAIRALEPPEFAPEVLAWARTCIFAPGDDTSVSRSMAELWTSRRLSEKFAVLRQTLYPSRAAMGRIYQTSPDSRGIYLYYPLRWLDLLLRYGRHAWGLWRGHDQARYELQAASERAALSAWLGG